MAHSRLPRLTLGLGTALLMALCGGAQATPSPRPAHAPSTRARPAAAIRPVAKVCRHEHRWVHSKRVIVRVCRPAAPARPGVRATGPSSGGTRGVPPARPTATGDRVSRVGERLVLGGRAWTFSGINVFGAATDDATNRGCGGSIDLPGLFGGLRPGSVVRFWASQGMAWDEKAGPGHVDFTGIDRVVAAADRTGQKLILTLSDQAGTCDDGRWHDQAWYDGGYRTQGLAGSYLDWVRLVVARYAGNPAVAFWEPVNEPEASDCHGGAQGSACYGAPRTCADSGEVSLRAFFDTVGAEIHALDPGGLVSTGFIGRKQCGVNGGGFDRIAASQQVDLLTYHDYSGADETMPPDLRDRVDAAHRDDKPLAVEEAGIAAGPSCGSPVQRADEFRAKMTTAFDAGIVGYLPWTMQGASESCGFSVGAHDPVFTVLQSLPATISPT